MFQHITIKQIQKPPKKEISQDVHWVCESLGFSTGRDLEQLTPKTVLEILRSVQKEHTTSSELLAEQLHITQARVNYHLRNLIDSGFIYRDRRQIFLRAGSVKAAVQEMRKDANRIFDELEIVAQEIDERVGLQNRH